MSECVVLESPYSGDTDRNIAYAQRAMFDARSKKEVVVASHLMWTQHHKAPAHYVVNFSEQYNLPNGGREEALRQLSELRRRVDKVVFYTDYGWSYGMKQGKKQCEDEKIPFEERQLGDTEQDEANVQARYKAGTPHPSAVDEALAFFSRIGKKVKISE